MYAELSDSNGLFNPADTIGLHSHGTSSTWWARIPESNPGGSGYRVRLRSNSPAYLSSINTLNVVIHPKPIANWGFIQNGNSVSFSDSSAGSSTLMWDFGDGNTSTSPYPSHTYSTSSPWTVRLISSNGFCSDTLTQIIGAVGISAIRNSDFEVFPNPSNEILNIRFRDFEVRNCVIQLISLDGKIVFETTGGQSEWKIPVAHLPGGIYQLSLHSDSGVAIFRIAVTH